MITTIIVIVFLKMTLHFRKDVGLDMFFPKELISSMKVAAFVPPPFTVTFVCRLQNCPPCVIHQPKQLRRLIQQTFQGYSTLNQEQCVIKFFNTLAQCYSFTQERFACQLAVRVTFVHQKKKKSPMTILTN